MEKTFTIYNQEYTIHDYSAICNADLPNESKRQNALLVTVERDGEKFEQIVFGYEMPGTVEAFRDMCEDSGAWESDWQVIKTVKK